MIIIIIIIIIIITSGCPIYAQSLRHNNLARYTSVAWYNRKPLPVIENDVIKVFRHPNRQTCNK